MLGGISIFDAENVLVTGALEGGIVLLTLLADIGGNITLDGTCVSIESLTSLGKAGKLEEI